VLCCEHVSLSGADVRSRCCRLVWPGLGGLIGYGESDDDDDDKDDSTPAQAASQSNTAAAISTVAVAAAPAASSSDLPDGWAACKDESSGDTYYWNQQTNETSWERPVALVRKAPSTPPGIAVPSVAPPPGIATATADVVEEKASTEEQPAESPTSSVPARESTNAEEGESSPSEQPDEDTPMIDAPAATSADPSPAIAASSTAPADATIPILAEDALPPGWQAVVDAESGDTYFWHEPTDQTSWERPRANVDDAKAAMDTAEQPAEAATPMAAPLAPAPVVPPAAPVVLSSTAQSLFISALLAGLHARTRDALDLPFVWPAGEGPVRDAISPMMHLHARLSWVEEEWTKGEATMATQEAAMVLEQLQQLMMDVDRVLAAEKIWRAGRRMPSQISAGSAAAASSSASTGTASSSAPAPSSAPPSAPRTSGAIHPARLGLVGVISAPPSCAPPAPSRKHAREGTAAAEDATGGVAKKAKLGKAATVLVQKWQQVSEKTAAEREQERLAKQEFFRMEAWAGAAAARTGAGGAASQKDG
jgi:hypothetical protein